MCVQGQGQQSGCLILKVTHLPYALKIVNHHDSRSDLKVPVSGKKKIKYLFTDPN